MDPRRCLLVQYFPLVGLVSAEMRFITVIEIPFAGILQIAQPCLAFAIDEPGHALWRICRV